MRRKLRKSSIKPLNIKSKSIIRKDWVDEEIESNSDESQTDRDVTEEESSHEEEDESIDQKRKRIALDYLQKFQLDHENNEQEISVKLQMEREHLQGKFYREFPFNAVNIDDLAIQKFKGHKLSVTSIALSPDESVVYSGSKDNSVIKWDTKTGQKFFLKKFWSRNENRSIQASSGEILAVTVSSDGRYVVSGGRDNFVRIYDERINNAEIKCFQGHRDAVTSLAFRKDTYTLFSGSLDRSIKHWDLNEVAYIETLFGHQEGVVAMDCWMRNKPITVSGDRTARVWNVDEESHALYRSNLTAIESVQYTGEDSFATGGQNGAISLWHSNLKKPVVTVESAHGIEKLSPRWICSLASNKVSDVLVSGSFDGFIKLWKIGGERRNVLTSMVNIPATGFVNSIAISSKLLVAGMGKEHKYGRWWNLKEAKNQIIILKLPHIND